MTGHTQARWGSAFAAVLAIAASCGDRERDRSARRESAPRAAAGPGLDSGPPPPPGIYISPGNYDFASHPHLLARLRESAYGYFRFTNIPFSQMVCERFADRMRMMPMVNLHGDAHVENYAVTKDGRGLADFDDSSAGPAVIDLVRFGTSLRLAARERGWDADADRMVSEFLRGYHDALSGTDADHRVPDFVTHARTHLRRSPEKFLAAADLLMQDVPAEERARFDKRYARYAAIMLGQHPDLDPHYFDIQRLGRLSVGYGSALDIKYLIRVRGPTDAPLDDVVLEAKQVRDLSGIDCINARASGGAFRILVGQARISEAPPRFLAQMPRADGDDPAARPFWVHAWYDTYTELDVSGDITARDLEQVAYDVGLQLGRGHVRQIAAPLDAQLRREQLETAIALDSEIRAAITDATQMVLVGWERFRAETDSRRSQRP